MHLNQFARGQMRLHLVLDFVNFICNENINDKERFPINGKMKINKFILII